MFRLTREIRFAVNAVADDTLDDARPTNSYAGFPSLTGLGHYFTLRVTLAGGLDPQSQYLRNIKEIDATVRRVAIPFISRELHSARFLGGGVVVESLFARLVDAWPGASLERIELSLSPFLSITALASELPMVRLSQKFEFSAAHRLHNPSLDEPTNRSLFGKCNNPAGHGHNYEVQVTLRGKPDGNGIITPVPSFERTVAETVIERFDHRHLNTEVAEFRDLIPSVENIAMVIYRLLKPRFAGEAVLASVTVWETPKTWCEYSEAE